MDNKSCIHLVETGRNAYDRKERHKIRRINFIKEYLDDPINRSQILWCSTNLMAAVALTKDLYVESYENHRSVLIGRGAYSDEHMKQVLISYQVRIR